MNGSGIEVETKSIQRRIRAANYLTVAQLFLQNNFLLQNPLSPDDIKPRLLGHWGTCPGINLVYANLKCATIPQIRRNFTFVLGPGHGFPALQANLFLDQELLKIDPKASTDLSGISYICKNFSWPGGFPSHASPITPGVICEGGELGYSLATAYGYSLNNPNQFIVTLIGDGEFETATMLASLNLNQLLASPKNGKILPILHLNGYKISGPTIAGRRSDRELAQLLRGFGFQPIFIKNLDPVNFQLALIQAYNLFSEINQKFYNQPAELRLKPAARTIPYPFIILKTDKGFSGPSELDGIKITGNYPAHQIPLKDAKTDPKQLQMLETWLKSYHFEQLFDTEKGFTL